MTVDINTLAGPGFIPPRMHNGNQVRALFSCQKMHRFATQIYSRFQYELRCQDHFGLDADARSFWPTVCSADKPDFCDWTRYVSLAPDPNLDIKSLEHALDPFYAQVSQGGFAPISVTRNSMNTRTLGDSTLDFG